MWNWLNSDRALQRAATDLYGSVVAQARSVQLYAEHGVPDTIDGRFEMVVLHLYAVIERLREERERDGADPRWDALAKAVTGRFVTDMDDNFREMGVGDLTVPRKVKKAAAVLYDRTMEYRLLEEAGKKVELAAAIAAHCRDGGEGTEAVNGTALEAYLSDLRTALRGQSAARILEGKIAFS